MHVTKQWLYAIIIIYHRQWEHKWGVLNLKMLWDCREARKVMCGISHFIVGVTTHDQKPGGMKRYLNIQEVMEQR